MTPEELVARLRQTCWVLYATGDIQPNVFRELEGLTKGISAHLLGAKPSSSNSKLDEIETRLSTLEAGLEKLIESHSIMLQQEELRNQTQFS